MAVLSSSDRQTVKAEVMRRVQSSFGGITKAQLQAAIDATDDWIDQNATAFNNALPTAAKNNLSASDKTLMFCHVALKRAGLL